MESPHAPQSDKCLFLFGVRSPLDQSANPPSSAHGDWPREGERLPTRALGGGLNRDFGGDGGSASSFRDGVSDVAHGEPHGSSIVLGSKCSSLARHVIRGINYTGYSRDGNTRDQPLKLAESEA